MSEAPRIILPAALVAYSSIDQRDRFGQFSIVVAVADDDGLKPLKSACGAAYLAKFGKKATGSAGTPFKAPEVIDEDFAGTVLVSAKSKRQPALIDRHKQPVADTVLLRGDRVLVSVVPYAWSRDGKTGVTLQVRGVLLVERSDGGVTDASQDFDDVEVPEPAIGPAADGEQVGEDDVVDDPVGGDADGEEF